ncbi:hypothetical protein OENI_130018 [Oenococcus oeni]|nr:hypothetical protein OENI_130018 [Oenococcus oeni]
MEIFLRAQIIEDSSKLLEKFWGSNVYDLQIKAMRKEKYDF